MMLSDVVKPFDGSLTEKGALALLKAGDAGYKVKRDHL
jgi:hypothetical protein